MARAPLRLNAMEVVDVAIVGGGPAGSSCAAFCAAGGLRVALIEREKFPREKVCGDCANPACLSILQRLGLANEIQKWPHAIAEAVDFISINGRTVRATFPRGARVINIKRSIFDHRLLERARELSAQVHEEATVVSLAKTRERDWKIDIVRDTFLARVLVGADGRNSTVARLCNLLPRPERERIALQAHIPLPRDFGNRIVLQFLLQGYSGQAPVNDRELNLCLVGTPPTISSLRKWADEHFKLSTDQAWRTITPLTRAPILAGQENLFFIGDAARVVEPFTGEGIYYALRSGELAAAAITKIIRGEDRQSAGKEFARAHRAMYRGRLWINQLARSAVLSPRFASRLLAITPISAPVLRALTRTIVKSIAAPL
jgi:geranylgeranyl reductase family protein